MIFGAKLLAPSTTLVLAHFWKFWYQCIIETKMLNLIQGPYINVKNVKNLIFMGFTLFFIPPLLYHHA